MIRTLRGATAWMFVTALFVFLGVCRIANWPRQEMPVPVSLALSGALGALAWSAGEKQRARVSIVAIAIASDAALRLVHAPTAIGGSVWIVWAVVLGVFVFRRPSPGPASQPGTWTWWKTAALVGLAAFLLLPPMSC